MRLRREGQGAATPLFEGVGWEAVELAEKLRAAGWSWEAIGRSMEVSEWSLLNWGPRLRREKAVMSRPLVPVVVEEVSAAAPRYFHITRPDVWPVGPYRVIVD